jgi:tRNA-dihydrouridine synthase B
VPVFFIQKIPVYGDLLLSPMDGFSDLPFRSICRELGSALSYTEFINTLELIQAGGNGKSSPRLPSSMEQKLAYLPRERPVVFQLFDNDPQRLLEAALLLQERSPDVVDINMGCSVRSVSGRGAGAGLLRDPGKVAYIFDLLSHHLDVPVTGKIRLGWDDGSRNYLEVARAIEDHGGAMVAVHARTRQQGYQGEADWEAIAEIKAAVSIPVIGNGDVSTVSDIERIKSMTGCDGVMIGRGAIGNPWIFSRLDRSQVTPRQVRQLMFSHLERMQEFYGEGRGLVLFRKHANRYLCHSTDPEMRRRLLCTENTKEFNALVHQIL